MNQQHLGLPGVLEIDRSSRDPQDRYFSDRIVTGGLEAIFDLEKGNDVPAPLHRALRAASMRGVIEPSAGGGALLRVLAGLLRKAGLPDPPEVVACDLDPRPDRSLGFDNVEWFRGDFRDRPWGQDRRFGLSIQNPPFRFAEESFRQAREIADYVLGVARVTFLESDERSAWLSTDVPDVNLLARRPKYDGSGNTDSCTSAWLIWVPGEPRAQGRFRVLP